DARPTRGDFGLVGARVIAPGDPFRSVLFYRISTEGVGHMPPIGPRLVDVGGVRLLGDWIRSLPAAAPGGAAAAEAEALCRGIHAGLQQCSGDTRAEVITALLSTVNGALALADRLRAADAAAFAAEVVARAVVHTNAIVRDLFQPWLAPEQRRRTLGTEPEAQSILALRGDAARGRSVFHGVAQCGRCHRHGSEGRAFGPSLEDLGRKYSPAQILEHILAPSRVIAPEFRTTVVTLRDGTEISGFVVRRWADGFLLRDENLGEHRIKSGDVKESHESALSAMPEGLLAPLTAQEAADLIAFLAAPGTTPP
ncbi:MAG TPA: hypothetical protein VNO52_06020, partial [Methylomirabilota bacterium]|nr:hypothetical protein [Methylomirabilota bacterium]